MQVRKDNETGEIYLTNPTTGFSIEDAEDFETLADVKPSPLAMSSVTGTVTVVGVKTLNKYNSCASCGKKATQKGKLIHCQHCDLTQRDTDSSQRWYARLYVQGKDNKKKFYLTTFHNELKTILEVNNHQLSPTTTEEDVIQTLLCSEDINLTYSIAESKVISINT